MLTLNQAIEHGKKIGVKYYVKNNHGCIVAGATTRTRAIELKKEFEEEEKRDCFSDGKTTYRIVPV